MHEARESASQNHGGPDPRGPKPVTIVVNGEAHEFPKADIAYAEVVALAFPNPPTGPNIEISVTYRRGRGEKPQGTLAPGAFVPVKDGMVFNVTATDKS